MSSAVLAVLAIGNKVSLFILGYRDWLKVKMRTLKPEYFLIIFCVTSYSYLILDFLKKSKIFANILKTSAQRVSFRPQIRVLTKFDICDQ